MSHGAGGDDVSGGWDWFWLSTWNPIHYPTTMWITNLNEFIVTDTGDNIIFSE
jgi:hypothetical protein